MRVVLVAGARPNFPKVAPLASAFAARGVTAEICHTGQHYDEAMSSLFFDELSIPRPRWNLDVGSGSHGAQTAMILERFERVLVGERPDLVVVVGDVNGTMACALAAAKCGVPVAHVEAGLRSFDRTMPEEVNRVVTDSIADLLYCSEPSGAENLRAEGVEDWRIVLAGNVMIDTLLRHRSRARRIGRPRALGLTGRYGVVTMHRPSNVDALHDAERLVRTLVAVAAMTPLVFPMHPRTRAALQRHGLLDTISGAVRVLPPEGYLEFLGLIESAALVLTDSGGVQEETTVLGVPCLTLRQNTERPATVSSGTNRIVGTDPDLVAGEARRALDHPPQRIVPDLWDGRAAGRVVEHVLSGALDRVRERRSRWSARADGPEPRNP